MVMFHPSNPNELISVSTGSVVTWTITKQGQTETLKGKLHPNPASGVGFTAVAYSKDNTAYTGASDGCIYRWKGSSLQGKGEKLHEKMVSALNIRADEKGKEILLTGSSDCTVKLFQIAGTKLTALHTLEVDGSPRSLDMYLGKVLVGTAFGTIQEIVLSTKASEDLILSHYDGEVWGLAIIDEENTFHYLTSGDDNSLLLYDIQTRRVEGRGYVNNDATSTKKFKGGASTMSKKPPHQQSRALAYNHELNHLAVG